MRVKVNTSKRPAPKRATQKSTTSKSESKKQVISADKKVQYLKYTVYRADHKAISDANAFYTKVAKIVKVKHGYELILTVKVAHGLVEFRPLTMSIGKIIKRTFKHSGKLDYWTYTTHVSSLAKLHQAVSGTMKMTVPIVNMKNAVYKVWFVFGVSKVAKTSLAKKAMENTPAASDTETTASGNLAASQPAASPSASSASASSQVPQESASAPVNSVASPSENTPAKTSPQKTNKQTKPKTGAISKETMPEIALRVYPFLPVIAGFFLLDLAIILLALYLRKRFLDRK